MILGKINILKRYKGINRDLDFAIDYIVGANLNNIPYGIHYINGENFYINRMKYVAKNWNDCFFESHDNYLDIHIVLDGKEFIGYTSIDDLSLMESEKYNPNNDLHKYYKEVVNPQLCRLEKDNFAIMFPEDAHLSQLMINDEPVEKIIFKIKCNNPFKFSF